MHKLIPRTHAYHFVGVQVRQALGNAGGDFAAILVPLQGVLIVLNSLCQVAALQKGKLQSKGMIDLWIFPMSRLREWSSQENR